MNIIVTGGCGFIGHNVVNKLQAEHQVTSYDSLTDYGIINATELSKLHWERKKFMKGSRVTGDIRDLKKVAGVFASESPDVVVHLASFPRAKVVNNDPIVGADVMSSALMKLLTTSKLNKVKRFVYISSSMVYGDFANGVTEEEVCKPKGAYAILKYSGELLVKDYCEANNIEYVIIRPSAVYGPRDVEDRVASKFLLNATVTVHGASEILDFTYVDDIANGICLATLSPNAANKTYNMTRSIGYTLLDAAKMAVKMTNSQSAIVVVDRDRMFPSRGTLSIEKAIIDLNYSPTVDLEEGFTHYYEWLNTSDSVRRH